MTPKVSTPKVSVIIPNYNYARFLEERIESVLSQSFQDFELILLDDRSTDNSREILERYRNHPKVSAVVINEENSGSPFRQWEKGLAMAKGEYAWIAEADDTALPRFLERTVAAMESAEDVALVKTMSELIDDKGGRAPKKYFESYEPDGCIRIYDGDEFLSKNMMEWNHCYNASMMLFRIDTWRALKEKPYLKMRYVGDWLFWGLLMAGHKIGDVSERLNCFRFHGKSVTDEAHTCVKAEAEVKIVQSRFLDMATGLSAARKMYFRYQTDKLFRREKFREIRENILAAEPDFGKNRRISGAAYPFYWFFKHIIWDFTGEKNGRKDAARPLLKIPAVR